MVHILFKSKKLFVLFALLIGSVFWYQFSYKLIFHDKIQLLTSGDRMKDSVHFNGEFTIKNFGIRDIYYDSIDSSCGCLNLKSHSLALGALSEGRISYEVKVPSSLMTPRVVEIVLSSKEGEKYFRKLRVEISLDQGESISSNLVKFIGNSRPERHAVDICFFKKEPFDLEKMNVEASIVDKSYQAIIDGEWQKQPRWPGSDRFCYKRKISIISKSPQRETVDTYAIISLTENNSVVKVFNVSIRETGTLLNDLR